MSNRSSPHALVVVTAVTALGTVLALGAGCPEVKEAPPLPPPPQECELDVNFDTTGAGVATAEGTSGVLCPAFDQDFWAVDVAEAGTILQVALSMPVGKLSVVNPSYRIIQDNGTPEGTPTPFSAEDPDRINNNDATDFRAAHRIEVPGRYYVVVADARFVDDATEIENAYTLKVEQLADPDRNEPNNDEDQATAVVAGAAAVTVTGQIATTGDQDWFAIDVPAGAQIADVTVAANSESGVDLIAVLVAADAQTEVLAGALVDEEDAAGDPTGVSSTRLRTRVDGGTRVYLVVRDDDDTDSQLDAALGAYSVSFSVLGNPDGNEGATGNDDAATATAMTSGTELQAALATVADQDVYRIVPPAGTTAANPRVLLVTVEVDGVISRDFQPQVTVIGADPEDADDPCNDACAVCDESRCKDARLQRFIDSNTFRTAYPLRDTRALYVLVNEANDDAFQEAGGYTLRLEIVDDSDPGEAGDDFLIPNLEFAGFANGDDLRAQFGNSKDRARVLATSFPPACDAEGVDPAVDNCLSQAPVPEPIDGINPDFTEALDCSSTGLGTQTLTATGRLTYEGDRDFFRFDLPPRAYFALNFRYTASGAAQTPLELALFVHRGDGQVISSTLEAEQTGSDCRDSTECDRGSICVDRNCWADRDDNATFSNQVFPDDDESCSFVSVVDDGPYYLEVVDNGINDFDTNLTYTITLDALCGCPAVCNVGGGLETRCQGVSDPT